jgi:hypothetical protein
VAIADELSARAVAFVIGATLLLTGGICFVGLGIAATFLSCSPSGEGRAFLALV